MLLTVARIGRAHGLRGEVALDLRTDNPEDRFGVGAQLRTEPAARGPLTVVSTRTQQGRWYVAFAQITDRTTAEAMRGTELVVEEDASESPEKRCSHESGRPWRTMKGSLPWREKNPAMRRGKRFSKSVEFVKLKLPSALFQNWLKTPTRRKFVPSLTVWLPRV